MDTRAPVEFARGSFPKAINLPLLTDEERAEIGSCYKKQGQAAAIALGHSLVSGATKQARIDAWLQFCRDNPQGYLFCFRGGLRSQICQQWLQEAGCDYPRVTGGYKAMRRFLIDSLDSIAERAELIVIAGHTGSAKTTLLETLDAAVDLEGLAHHRGSAFGRRVGGQPSQIDFENALAIALLKKFHTGPQSPIFLEDESRLIGRCALPQKLREAMQQAPLVVVEESLDFRVEHTYQKYILDKLNEWQNREGEDAGFAAFAEDLTSALYRIRKRLGGDRFPVVERLMQDALQLQSREQPDLHREWIRYLLDVYYDPMYRYQMQKQEKRILFRGSLESVERYLKDRLVGTL